MRVTLYILGLLLTVAAFFNPYLLVIPAVGAIIIGGIMLFTPKSGDIGEIIKEVESEPVEVPSTVPAKPQEPVPA